MACTVEFASMIVLVVACLVVSSVAVGHLGKSFFFL